MFTGIITDIGVVKTKDNTGGDAHFTIKTNYDMKTIVIGASIACSGCCLTVTEKGADWFTVDVSAETLSKTNLGSWEKGSRINLERSLKMGDELGGHIVSGHVDGVAKLFHMKPEGDSHRLTFEVPKALAKYIASKGSVAIDGVSLTINEVEETRFGVNIISHTWDHTSFSTLKEGDIVNIEIDMLARYVARILECRD